MPKETHPKCYDCGREIKGEEILSAEYITIDGSKYIVCERCLPKYKDKIELDIGFGEEWQE